MRLSLPSKLAQQREIWYRIWWQNTTAGRLRCQNLPVISYLTRRRKALGQALSICLVILNRQM